jgi:predicted alpha-1,2-mannosidase
MAEILNKPKAAEYFYNRSLGYQRVFDHETQFMRAKFSNNSWKTPFNPRESRHVEGDYTEGNAWQHLWFVPHDVLGLIKLFSRESLKSDGLSEWDEHQREVQAARNIFEARLDQLFSEESVIEGSLASVVDISGLIGQYAHGNEPSHHVAYLYNYLEYGNGQGPHKTQARVRQILNEMYNTSPNGLAGNEDCGQMSAWYVFSALGFYPVNPVEGKYQLGSPLFDYAAMDVGKGKKFEVKADGAGTRGDVFVKKVRLNGQILKRWYITHDEIMNGGVLEFEMSSEI